MKMISDDFAVYLPAVNTMFADALVRPIPDGRPFPDNLSLDDLKFWQPKNPLWHHPHFLHSVGQYRVGTTPDNAVTRRGRTDGILFGDSGGYQIGKGSLTGLNTLYPGMPAEKACSEWRKAYEARRWILDWLETYTNWAMTIDMPLWVRDPKGTASPFHECSQEQLQQLTVENLQFIDSHRQDRTKWLNVLQGQDAQSIQKWWDAVKWFPCSGYALGGDTGWRGGLHSTLSAVLMLRDSGALVPGQDWLHLLGVSTAKWAVVLSALQKAIQAHINPKLRISFDSATPFYHSGKRESLVNPLVLGKNSKGWRFASEKSPQSQKDVGSDAPLPFASPLAKQLTVGHFSVRGGIWDRNKYDTLTRVFLTHHNIWVLLDGMRRANEAVFVEPHAEVPSPIRECVDLIGQLFTFPDPRHELDKCQPLFAEFQRA